MWGLTWGRVGGEEEGLGLVTAWLGWGDMAGGAFVRCWGGGQDGWMVIPFTRTENLRKKQACRRKQRVLFWTGGV